MTFTVEEFRALRELNGSLRDRFVEHFNRPNPLAAFRDPDLEKRRKEFMGEQKEAAVPEPEPEFIGQMPVAPEVGERLKCTVCGAETDGTDKAWSPLAVSPQGKWVLKDGVWWHKCRYGVLSPAVNPGGEEYVR